MIYSMTAFARNQQQGDWGLLTIEIKSINHRFLEVMLNLPEPIRAFEMTIREKIRKTLQRGKIDCVVRFQSAYVDEPANINLELAKALCQASDKIATMLNSPAGTSPFEVLRYPGVLQNKENDSTVLQNETLNLLEKTLQDLISVREREGKELAKLFFKRCDLIEQELGKVSERTPVVITEQEARIRKRFSELQLDVDKERFEQEMVYFIQKIDIHEEIDRAKTHVGEIRRVIKEGGAIGRRLDFLLQELNREANTLGSKSVDPVMTHAAVEMKVLIEQIREQVQNVE